MPELYSDMLSLTIPFLRTPIVNLWYILDDEAERGIWSSTPPHGKVEMLKHLWRSLIAVRRHARYRTEIGRYKSRLEHDQKAYELQIAQYQAQRNSFQLQQQDAASNGQSVEALQAMVVTLQKMIENSKPLRVARFGTYAFTDDEGNVR